MTLSHALRRNGRRLPCAALAGALLGGCAGHFDPSDEVVGSTTDLPSEPSLPTPPDVGSPFPGFPGSSAACDPTISVSGHGSAFVVRDPAVLAAFPLERVLKQLIELGSTGGQTPIALLQELFDTENTDAGGVFPGVSHCDGMGNGAFKNGPAIDCPRAEGALASSAGLLIPGHPDYFAPVAIVNRFDLMTSNLDTCGEYRIVYAKWSGRSDPENRAFLIFEGALQSPSPGNIDGCRPIASMWASLDNEKDPAVIGARLEQFLFTGGLGKALPLIHPNSFGVLGSEDDAYGAQHGQIRLSQRMQVPLQMREFRLAITDENGEKRVHLNPATVKNTPLPALFDSTTSDPRADAFRGEFNGTQIAPLGAASVAGIRMAINNNYTAGESAIEGAAQTEYWSRLKSGAESATFLNTVTQQIAVNGLGRACPPDDPLTARSILDRAAMQTCAGCHAPTHLLGPSRKIGCGLTWPNTNGEVHIDEHGTLSPALTQVFLPHRASVMTTYLQACDAEAIQNNLQPAPNVGIPK